MGLLVSLRRRQSVILCSTQTDARLSSNGALYHYFYSSCTRTGLPRQAMVTEHWLTLEFVSHTPPIQLALMQRLSTCLSLAMANNLSDSPIGDKGSRVRMCKNIPKTPNILRFFPIHPIHLTLSSGFNCLCYK